MTILFVLYALVFIFLATGLSKSFWSEGDSWWVNARREVNLDWGQDFDLVIDMEEEHTGTVAYVWAPHIDVYGLCIDIALIRGAAGVHPFIHKPLAAA